MICPECGEMMDVSSNIRMKEEGKEPRNPVSFVCPACKHSEYKEYKSK